MAVNRILGVVAVSNHAAAVAWYERLLGRPADATPMPGLAEWHLGESGGFQLIQGSDYTGSAQLTIIVSDVEAHVADLAARGLVAGETNTGVVGRFTSLADPEGNTIVFADSYGGKR